MSQYFCSECGADLNRTGHCAGCPEKDVVIPYAKYSGVVPEEFISQGEKGQLKPSNPKDLVGVDKVPLHLWPETATIGGCLALLDGNLKYGRTNWRAIGIKASVYADAAKRHLNAWFDEGEDIDPDSGLEHLWHLLASVAILIDAKAADKLVDDRLIHGGYRKMIDAVTPHVKRLKEKHKDKHPYHYDIKDSE